MIVDLILKEGSGFNVIARARRNSSELKIAVFSAYATPGIRKHCRSVGADAVFDKTETLELASWLEGLKAGPA